MSADRYDMVVIGAGIHGAGVAQAAAAAGYSALVLEQSGIASGTSSRSSKLIHGGLRYLETAQFGLVRECLRERALLLKLAPSLVRLTPVHIPVYGDTRRRPWQLRAGLSLYAALGGLQCANRFDTIPRREWEELDGLETRGLQRVFRYCEAQTDDLRLTRAVIASARSLGARLAMPARFTGASLGAAGCAVRYLHEGRERECEATVLINAAGPWARTVLDRIEDPGAAADTRPAQASTRPSAGTAGSPPAPPHGGTVPAMSARAPAISLIQGTHLVLDGRLEQGIYYMEAPGDGRAVFAMPWRGRLLLGTTETPYTGDPAGVAPLPRERDYLLETLAHYFPAWRRGAAERVREAWAGLRVLPGDADEPAFRRPRDVVLDTDRPERPRLLSIYGGKLTAYRATAEKVMRRLRASLPSRTAVASTRTLPLVDPD